MADDVATTSSSPPLGLSVVAMRAILAVGTDFWQSCAVPASRRTGVVLVLVVTAIMAWLALSLPADAFFSGDSGLKLIAARNAIAHPSRPFDVDLPIVNGRPAPYVDPMLELHGDHAYALQSPIFPVLSA